MPTQFKEAGYLVTFQATNLLVMVSDDPMPAPVLVLMSRQQYDEVMQKHPGAIRPAPVMHDGQGRVVIPVNDDPITLKRDLKFPPDAGNWTRTPDGDLIIGCPKCGTDASIKAPPFSLRPDGTLLPSFICEKCKLHCMLTLDNVRPDPDNCTTCGCTVHIFPCAHLKGGKECGCVDGTGWQPKPVQAMPATPDGAG